jgi:hypothetical protein
VWWQTLVISTLRRLRQENYKFKASLGFILRPYLNKQRKQKKKQANKNLFQSSTDS